MNQSILARIRATAIPRISSSAFALTLCIGLVAADPARAAGVSVFSFGENTSGKTSLDTDVGGTPVATAIDPVNLGSLSSAQVSASDGDFLGGGGHSHLLADDGTVFALGNSRGGQGGTGGTSSILQPTPIDENNLGALTVVDIAAGSFHSMLRTSNGTVFSFGLNSNGRAGLGAVVTNALIATAIDTSNLGTLDITQISAGDRHGLVLADDGSVYAFGSNLGGRTGLGTTVGDKLIATPIDTSLIGELAIVDISAETNHSLLLAENGTVFSFGFNSSGGTGLGIISGETSMRPPSIQRTSEATW